MAAINKRRERGSDYVSFNSGILLSILKHARLNSDIAQQIIHEWCKHVSHILVTRFVCKFWR